jgi:hypothetical protein
VTVRHPAVVIVVLLGIGPAPGHDLWLIPPEAAGAGKTATVRAVSGSDFPRGDHAPDPAAFAKRLLVKPDGAAVELDAAGTDADAGLLRFTPDAPGVYVAAVRTTAKLITLDAAAFNEYLVSDGLPHIYRLRAKEKTLDQPGRERYSKSPKLLIRVGDGAKGDSTKPVGLPLEIVPMRDPFAVKPGDALKVRVLFEGKPLADANLGWAHPGGGELPAGTVRTDERGEALVPVAKVGLMTIRLTHMTRPNAADYEWESFWTTLTFRVPGG